MVEAAAGIIELAEDSWVHEHDYLSDNEKQTLGTKYNTQEDAIKAIPHATKKFAELDKQLKAAVHWPDEKTSDEDRAKFTAQMNKHRGVPEAPEGYEIEHPELPEGMAHDAEFENKIRAIAKERNVSQEALAALAKEFSDYRISQHNAVMAEAKSCIDALVTELGQSEANRILGYKDTEGKQVMGTAKRGMMMLSSKAGLDYTDDHNAAQSQLIDAIERVNPSGCLGNQPALIIAGQWLWDNVFSEGHTPAGSPPEGGGEPGVFTKEFYAKTDEGKDVE
jgi:hypothetical protein